MKIINTAGGLIEFYDSPMQLPESQRTEHNCYALIEAGIGSDFESVDEHFQNMIALFQAGSIEDGLTELNNLRFFFYNTFNKQYSAASLALASLTHSVCGERWGDYTESGLTTLVKRFSEMGLTDELIRQTWTDVKKNSNLN